MNQEPEPGAESSGESGSASSRSQKTIYYDFQFQHGDNDECYAEELNGTQPKRAGEDGTFDSGNFSETVENGSHPCPSPLFQAPLPMFTIGSPLLRRCSSSTYNTGKSRVDADSEQVNPSQEPSGDSQKPNPTSTSSTSGRREATMTTRSDSYLHDLVGNFNTLYEQKLNEVAKKSIGGEGDQEYNVVQKQNAVMREWVRDLNEQNAVLIETVNDMEKEADEKIELLQVKIQRSTQMVMEHMEIIQQYEKQVQELVDQRTESDKEFEMLRSEALAMDKKRKMLQDKLCALEADHASLITLMTRIRDWGLWDITGLTLSPKTHYHLFGLYPNLPGSEVQTVFTQERARQVKETEHRLEALQTEFEKLQKERDEAMNQIRDQDSSITSKQAEIDNLLRRIEQIESEKGEIKRKLEDTQDTLTQTINTANAIPRIDQAAHDAEMNELFKELRSLKQDLHVACTERQNAMSEASTLKAEMSQRLLEMSQMKNLLVSIQLETETTRGRVQDVQIKQDQLATLQEQVKMYQEKYEDARAMLNNKTDMIENLQQQMDQLHEKVTKIEQVNSSPDLSGKNARFASPSQSNIICPPTLPPRRHPEEKLKALSRKPEALLAAAKSVDTASRAMRELERQKEEEAAANLSRSRFAGDRLPWNEYFYNQHTNSTYLKELEALTAEQTTALTVGKPVFDKNKMAAPQKQRDDKKSHSSITEDQDKNKVDVDQQKRREKKAVEKSSQSESEKPKIRPLAVRYPARSPREAVVAASALDPESPRTRSRSVDMKKTAEPPLTSRRSHSKTTKPAEVKVTKGILRKSDSGNPPTRKSSKPSLRSAQHEKITKYFSDRYGIHIENPKIVKTASTPTKSTETEVPYVKERIKFAPYVSSKSAQNSLAKKTSDRRVNFDIPERHQEKEPPKTSRSQPSKFDEYLSPDQVKMIQPASSRQPNIREISSGGDQEQTQSETSEETVIFPRVGSRPSTREEKLSSLPSGGLGYIPSTDPYELRKLEALVHAAVNTSKQLINSIDPAQGNVRMRVTASHRRHVQAKSSHHRRSEKYQSPESSPERQYSCEDTGDLSDLPSNITPQIETTSEEEVPSKIDTSPEAIQYLRRRTNDLTKPYDPKKPISTPRPGVKPSRRQEEILASLPVQKHETVVKNWIIRSGFERPLEDTQDTNMNVEPRVHLHSFEAHARKTEMRRVSHRSHRPPEAHLRQSFDNSDQTPLDKFPKAGDVNLQKMSRNVDHWVSRKKEESSDTDSSFEKAPAGPKQGHSQGQGDDWCQNNNMTSNISNSHKSIEVPQTNTVSAEELEKLNARILSLESQCKSKDTLIQSLECELNVEKDFKKRIQAEMASREAEVTMQKAIQLTTISATLNNQMISTHFDKKNNTLLRQCYDLLTKIEPDYLQENQAMGRGISDWVASINPTSYEDTDVENLRVMLKGSKMEAVLTAIIDENKELKEKLGEEIKHSGNLQNELNLNKSSRADEMASQLYNLISTLEHENSQLKSEINNLTGNCSDSSVRSSTSPKNADVDFQADILKRDEMIRLQKQQIHNFEEYIQRLHTEIKQWTSTTSNQPVVPESENGSIIAHLQENIKQFQEFSKAKTERHLELMMVIKTMKQELQNSRKREIELKSDNQMLHQTVATLNVKLADLIKSFERLQYQFGSPHMSAWASIEFSDTSDGIQNGNHDLHSICTTPENRDVPIMNLQSPAVAGRSCSRAPFIPRNCSTPCEESVTKHQHLIREYNFYYDETVKITRCCHEPFTSMDLRTNTI